MYEVVKLKPLIKVHLYLYQVTEQMETEPATPTSVENGTEATPTEVPPTESESSNSDTNLHPPEDTPTADTEATDAEGPTSMEVHHLTICNYYTCIYS